MLLINSLNDQFIRQPNDTIFCLKGVGRMKFVYKFW